VAAALQIAAERCHFQAASDLTALLPLLQDKDEVNAQRVLRATLSMKKLDITVLERTYHSE